MTGQLRWARRRTGAAKKQIFSRLRIRPWFGRPDHASLVMTEGRSSYPSPEPDVDDAMNASLTKHPPIAHVVVGSYVAAGVFDLLSALPVGFIPTRDVYRAATFLLILATSAGFRCRQRVPRSGQADRVGFTDPTAGQPPRRHHRGAGSGCCVRHHVAQLRLPVRDPGSAGGPACYRAPVRAHWSRRSPGRCSCLSAWRWSGSRLPDRAEQPNDLSR